MRCGIKPNKFNCKDAKNPIDEDGWFSCWKWKFKIGCLEGTVFLYSKCGTYKVPLQQKKGSIREFESFNNENQIYKFEILIEPNFSNLTWQIESVSFWK